MTPEITSKVEQIITEIDDIVLLSSAWDCMTEAAKARFKKRLELILLSRQVSL